MSQFIRSDEKVKTNYSLKQKIIKRKRRRKKDEGGLWGGRKEDKYNDSLGKQVCFVLL